MIKVSELDGFKAACELQINQMEEGAVYVIVDGDTVTWKLASEKFDIEELYIGAKVRDDGAERTCIKERRTVTVEVHDKKNGINAKGTATPVINEEGEIVGAVSVILPAIPPLISSFQHFAPIMAEMFPEGVVLYTSDLEKIVERQGTKKFDVRSIQVGDMLTPDSTGLEAMRTNKLVMREDDGSVFGIPVLIVSYPVFRKDSSKVVGSFGIIIPKASAKKVKDASRDLNEGLVSIEAAAQELAATSSQINTSEMELSEDIKRIYELSEGIEKISEVISDISAQTNILGINASIEAARSGEAGRGFGIVAKEIRTLSTQTKDTVIKIKEFTQNIKEAVEETNSRSDKTLASSQEQSAATEEITSSIEALTNLSQSLTDISDNL
ncbi:chemotaxis protein [Clostridium acetobutylicum]|nr:chemotaxis protein [Clostridium acetobutylicum]